MGAARSMDAPLGLQRHLTVPLFATSAVTGSGIPLLHAFLASLRSTAQQPASALASPAPVTCPTVPCLGRAYDLLSFAGHNLTKGAPGGACCECCCALSDTS